MRAKELIFEKDEEDKETVAMSHSRSIPTFSVLLILSLSISCFPSIFSLNVEGSHSQRPLHAFPVADGNYGSQHSGHVRVLEDEDDDGGWSLWGSRRTLLAADEGDKGWWTSFKEDPKSDVGNGTSNSSVILAAERTRREDPLNDYKLYTGGWNITNRHYWASVAFTAVPFFTLSVVWFFCFGVVLSCMCLYFCCCRKTPRSYSSTAFSIAFMFLMLFTVGAIAGSVTLYVGQGKLRDTTVKTLDYVVGVADTTAENLLNVSGYLLAAKDLGVDSVFLPANVRNDIASIHSKINVSAFSLDSKTGSNSKGIKHVISSMGVPLVVVAAAMLILVFLGFLFSILGWGCLVYFLVILGWFLVASMFILCGVFLLLHNSIADTCTAMDEWVKHPVADTTLDQILPCVDNATAQETLKRSKDVTYQLVTLVNGVIRNVSNVDVPPVVGPPLYINQSGPLVPLLCNPFNSDLSDRQCASGELDFNNATQVWKNYTCEVSAQQICTTTGRLTPKMYADNAAAVNVSYGLYHYSPFLVSIQDCSFVRQTLSDISANNCPGLSRYTRWIYTGSVILAASVMFSVIFWLVYAQQRRHRSAAKTLMT